MGRISEFIGAEKYIWSWDPWSRILTWDDGIYCLGLSLPGDNFPGFVMEPNEDKHFNLPKCWVFA